MERDAAVTSAPRHFTAWPMAVASVGVRAWSCWSFLSTVARLFAHPTRPTHRWREHSNLVRSEEIDAAYESAVGLVAFHDPLGQVWVTATTGKLMQLREVTGKRGRPG